MNPSVSDQSQCEKCGARFQFCWRSRFSSLTGESLQIFRIRKPKRKLQNLPRLASTQKGENQWLGQQYIPYSTNSTPGGSLVKNPSTEARDASSIPGLGRSPGEGNGNPLHYSCWEHPMDRGAQGATVHGVAKELYMTQLLNNNNPANQMTTPVRILYSRCQKHCLFKDTYLFILAAQGLSCSMWDLLPQPGTKPGLLHQEYGFLATGPPGKSPKSTIFIAFCFFFPGFFPHFYFSDRKTTSPITKVMTSCLWNSLERHTLEFFLQFVNSTNG